MLHEKIEGWGPLFSGGLSFKFFSKEVLRLLPTCHLRSQISECRKSSPGAAAQSCPSQTAALRSLGLDCGCLFHPASWRRQSSAASMSACAKNRNQLLLSRMRYPQRSSALPFHHKDFFIDQGGPVVFNTDRKKRDLVFLGRETRLITVPNRAKPLGVERQGWSPNRW